MSTPQFKHVDDVPITIKAKGTWLLGWNACVEAHQTLEGQTYQQSGIDWAVSRWDDEVKHRPLVNVHRRTLDDTWRQVIRYFGGNPDALLGPSHDQLLIDEREARAWKPPQTTIPQARG